MACECCGRDIKKGQFIVAVSAFVVLTDFCGRTEDVPVVMEDGALRKYAHYGCLMRLSPALVGIHIGEPLRE